MPRTVPVPKKIRTERESDPDSPVAPAPETPRIPAADIAKRAYEKFLARDCQHGCDQEDWFTAERELVEEASRRMANAD